MYKHLLTLLIIPLSMNAWATDLDTLSMRQVALDEIVVRSFKQDRSFRNTPISVTAITGPGIEKQNISSIKDFSALVPNLFMPDYGSKLTSPVYIRGVGSKVNAMGVGLYIDGVPYFDKASFDFDFNDIDRVEVLRGPQGTLYGRNTIGGLINVYTKSPFKYEGTNITLSAGNYANVNASVSHYGNVSQTFGYSLAANYRHTDGYFTNINPAASRKVDRANSASERIRLSWRVTPRLDLHLASSFDYSMQGGYPYAPYDSTGHWGPINYNDYSSYERSIFTNGFTADYRGDHFRLNSQTSYQYLSDDQRIDQDFTPADVYFVVQDQKLHTFSQEVNIKSLGDRRYKWLFGTFLYYQHSDNIIDMDYKQKGKLTHKLFHTPTIGAALYHQSTFDDLLTDGLSLTLGLRYEVEHIRTTFDFNTVRDEASSQDKYEKMRQTFNQLLPRASLQYNFTPMRMVYATVSKGYKTGGYNTSFDDTADATFDPEYTWNYETGTKLSFWGNRLSTELSLFYIDWRHQQVSQVQPVGAILRNAGKSVSKGVEASAVLNPFHGFNLMVNYGYTHATFKEYTRTKDQVYDGNYLPYIPRHTFSAGVDYTWEPRRQDLVRKVIFSSQFSGAGKIYWKEDNVASQPFYGILNGKVSVITNKLLTFEAWIKNATNTTYDAYYFESGSKQRLAQRGKPLTVGVNLVLNL